MYATLKNGVHNTAVLCLLVLLLLGACKKEYSHTITPQQGLSIEEVNNLTVDSNGISSAYINQTARSGTTLQVEAEDYSAMSGIQAEPCREGGKNVGYISPGDWMDYTVNVPASGNYDMAFRIAGPNGTLQVQLPGNQVLATVNFNGTTSGQIYATSTASVSLNAGQQTIRIAAVTGYWNFNWFSITSQDETQSDNININNVSTGNNLMLTSTFENELDFKSWNKEICRWTAVQLSNEVARKGQTSVRFELTKQDVLDFSGFTRAEIRRPCETEAERWYGFSNFLPTGYAADGLAEMIAQWHDIPDFDLGESWRSPPISFKIINDHYYVHYLWAGNAVNTDLSKSGEQMVDLGPVDKNTWNDWVFHIKFSYRSDGILEVWKNKNKIFSYYGPNSYNDKMYPYFKLGIYKWGWNGWASYSPENKRVLFYDEVKIGNGNSGMEEVSAN
jgi:hypothetical protein